MRFRKLRVATSGTSVLWAALLVLTLQSCTQHGVVRSEDEDDRMYHGPKEWIELVKTSKEFQVNLLQHNLGPGLKWPGTEHRHNLRPSPHHNKEQSRGILIAAGGRNMLATALATVKLLRTELNCRLPVEVAYLGEGEADVQIIGWLKEIPNVLATDMEAKPYPPYHHRPEEFGGYFFKTYAIYQSAFDQILYMDSDNLPLENPDHMFAWREFAENGNLFWPDYVGIGTAYSPAAYLYTDMGREPPWAKDHGWRASETGQILLDRRKHRDVLEWLLFLNSHSDVVYRHMHGDKDTFELAFALAGKQKEFRKVQYWPRGGLSAANPANEYVEEEFFAHLGILQCSPRGMPVFLHRVNGGKWDLEGNITEEHFVPAFTTPGMSEHAMSDFWWESSIDNKMIPNQNAIRPDDIQCDNLDYATLVHVEEHNHTRWHSCFGQNQQWEKPIPIIPLEWFPKSILSALNAGIAAFQEVQARARSEGIALQPARH